VNICHVKELILGKANYSVWYCIDQWHKFWKCWNNYSWILITFIDQECGAAPKDVKVQPEGTVCCCICHTSAPVWTGWNTFLDRIVTVMIHGCTTSLQSRLLSTEWLHKGSLSPKEFKI
jgi:hypothetical protein